ncbi:MAG TPA: CoA-binding protein [Bacteroidia bacterium]
MNKPTVIIGSSENPERYAQKALVSLQKHGHTVYPVGLKEGTFNGTVIYTNNQNFESIDTVTLYVGPKNQPYWYEYIFSLKPKRIIFNPGTESNELMTLAKAKGIETIEACTLVMLSIGVY